MSSGGPSPSPMSPKSTADCSNRPTGSTVAASTSTRSGCTSSGAAARSLISVPTQRSVGFRPPFRQSRTTPVRVSGDRWRRLGAGDVAEPSANDIAADGMDDRRRAGRKEGAVRSLPRRYDSPAYGTTPEKLRDGLQVVASQDEVWISPGIPFIVPMFVGTVIAFTYGDMRSRCCGSRSRLTADSRRPILRTHLGRV